MIGSPASHLVREWTIALLLLLGSGGCNGDASLGPRTTEGQYQLVSASGHLVPLADASVRLTITGNVEIRRVYLLTGDVPDTYLSQGLYELRGDSLRVSWDRTTWYTWGSLRGDSLTLAFTGIADEYIVERYLRR